MTVLLVEDDPNDILLIKRAYEKNEINNPLKVIRDGEEAIKYFEGMGKYSDRDEYPYPILIILDLKLPKKSGLEVLEWLKNHPRIKRIPVIVLSSSKEPSDINKAYELGVNSYLLKPVSFDNLHKIIEIIKEYWIKLNEEPDL